MLSDPPPPISGNLLGGPDLTSKNFNFVRVFGLRKFLASRTPPPVGKFAGRSRSDLKKISILLGFFNLENIQPVGPPPVGKFAGSGFWT